MPSSSARPDNVSVSAVGPSPSQNVPGGSTTTCELTDAQWVAQRYANFKSFVHSLESQERKLEEWASWLDTVPLGVFLAGGDSELKGVREASDDAKRSEESGLVLERWALQYSFVLSKITAADQDKLQRYVLLFSAV